MSGVGVGGGGVFRLLCQQRDREPEVLDAGTSEAEAAHILGIIEGCLRGAFFKVETDALEVRAINPVTMALECRYWAQARVDGYC